ncbi:MAG: response regulator [Desulfatiglandaceae bacterium]|jgi:DNA-binding response OmpR family regulator
MRILLIDDEVELVSTLAERLSFRGIEADWATSGREALEKVAEASYDIAVVDIKMPRIGGIELKRMMAEKYPHMKFIFMTGHGSEEDFRTGSEEAGAAYYLVKPVDIEELMKKLNEVLKR